tara:strand:- start:6392 stop:6700 length:309 start_codon:yes stop_codon:yes gene_type:complete
MKYTTALVLLIVCSVFPTVSVSQLNCNTHKIVTDNIKNTGGVQSDIAIQSDGLVLEIYRNLDNGKYIIILSDQAGTKSCIVSGGPRWKRLIIPVKNPLKNNL